MYLVFFKGLRMYKKISQLTNWLIFLFEFIFISQYNSLYLHYFLDRIMLMSENH